MLLGGIQFLISVHKFDENQKFNRLMIFSRDSPEPKRTHKIELLHNCFFFMCRLPHINLDLLRILSFSLMNIIEGSSRYALTGDHKRIATHADYLCKAK